PRARLHRGDGRARVTEALVPCTGKSSAVLLAWMEPDKSSGKSLASQSGTVNLIQLMSLPHGSQRSDHEETVCLGAGNQNISVQKKHSQDKVRDRNKDIVTCLFWEYMALPQEGVEAAQLSLYELKPQVQINFPALTPLKKYATVSERSLLVQQITKLWNGQGTGNKEKTAEKFIIEIKVKDQNAEAEQAYEEAQASDALEYPSSEEEEGIKLEREFEATKPKFKRSSHRERPPAHNPDYYSSEMCPSAPLEGPRGGVTFPVIETHNAQGQLQREHVPLDFKDIKQLKEAVLAYGTHAPFTLAIFESFTALHCAPCDWQQLCRAALSGGDYLLWRSEFQELCQQIANQNAAAGFPGRNLDMLTGTGQYADLAAQIQYDPAVYAQIIAAAMRAWKALPNKASGEQLSKVIQRPSEPFSEFVDRLLQLAGKIFGNADRVMPIDGEIPVWVPERCVRTVDAFRSRPDGAPRGESTIVAV
ncbi:hypothetical protein STEG23_017473, partial [Scotinomys teguina]